MCLKSLWSRAFFPFTIEAFSLKYSFYLTIEVLLLLMIHSLSGQHVGKCCLNEETCVQIKILMQLVILQVYLIRKMIQIFLCQINSITSEVLTFWYFKSAQPLGIPQICFVITIWHHKWDPWGFSKPTQALDHFCGPQSWFSPTSHGNSLDSK